MVNDSPDKKPLPESDQLEPMTTDSLSPRLAKENEEQDLDELVHNNLQAKIKPNEEIDADDAVHNSTIGTKFQPGTESDPDDLVHGN